MNKKAISIILAIMLTTSLSACGKKGDIYSNTDLSQYKTDYVGDAPNVVNIVSHQEYPKEYSYDSIEIQSETEPYGLTVFLKGESSVAKLENKLQSNANITFDEIEHIAGCPVDHSFLTYKKELTAYGYEVAKISIKNKTVNFTKVVLEH